MLSADERKRVKTQTALAVRDCGGQEVCAEVSERIRRHASFSEYGNPQLPDRVIPLDVAAELDRWLIQAGRRPRFASMMAGLCDHILVPDPRAAGAGSLLNLAGKSAEEVGKLVACVIAATMDGRIDATERAELLAKIEELMGHLASLAEQVRASAETSGDAS